MVDLLDLLETAERKADRLWRIIHEQPVVYTESVAADEMYDALHKVLDAVKYKNKMSSRQRLSDWLIDGMQRTWNVVYLLEDGKYICTLYANFKINLVTGEGETEDKAIDDALKRWSK